MSSKWQAAAEGDRPSGPLGEVTVEAIGWVTRFVGGNGTSRLVFHEPLQPGDTVRSVLQRMSDRHPKLAEALWDRNGNLAEHIEIMVNNGVLGAYATLDTELTSKDTVALLGQFMGG